MRKNKTFLVVLGVMLYANHNLQAQHTLFVTQVATYYYDTNAIQFNRQPMAFSLCYQQPLRWRNWGIEAYMNYSTNRYYDTLINHFPTLEDDYKTIYNRWGHKERNLRDDIAVFGGNLTYQLKYKKWAIQPGLGFLYRPFTARFRQLFVPEKPIFPAYEYVVQVMERHRLGYSYGLSIQYQLSDKWVLHTAARNHRFLEATFAPKVFMQEIGVGYKLTKRKK